MWINVLVAGKTVMQMRVILSALVMVVAHNKELYQYSEYLLAYTHCLA